MRQYPSSFRPSVATVARPVRLVVVLLVAGALALTAALAVSGCRSSSSVGGSRTAATVNGTPISQSDVDQVAAASAIGGGTKLSNADALEVLVRQTLIAAEARRLGITVSAADLQKRLAVIAAAAGGQTELHQALSSVGLSLGGYRQQVARSLLAERVAAAKFPKVTASRAAALAYYQKHLDLFTVPAQAKIGDIVVKSKISAENAAARIRGGEPFGVTARQFTFDPELKASSGQLGWIALDSLPAPLKAAVAKLRAGQLSRPVQAENGWHVLKVYGRRAQTTYDFDRTRSAIVRELTGQKRATALEEWLVGIRARAQVVTSP
jgi:parvulin-like peptidyl-prolyl isomerase